MQVASIAAGCSTISKSVMLGGEALGGSWNYLPYHCLTGLQPLLLAQHNIALHHLAGLTPFFWEGKNWKLMNRAYFLGVIVGTIRTLKKQRNKCFYEVIILLSVPFSLNGIRTLGLWIMRWTPYLLGQAIKRPWD